MVLGLGEPRACEGVRGRARACEGVFYADPKKWLTLKLEESRNSQCLEIGNF